MSDIHGEYDKFMEILEMIDFSDDDTLYILGDILDRGPHPIKTLLKVMEMPNVFTLLGNHELMALDCLDFLQTELTDASLDLLTYETMDNLYLWELNGCKSTLDEFRSIDNEQREAVIDFLKDLYTYVELEVNGNDYLLVHAGLGNFSPGKKMDEYTVHELVWERGDYGKRYFKDKTVICGHTPTLIIEGNKKPGYIYYRSGNIVLDCGACFEGGRLSCLRLDDGKEYYSSYNPLKDRHKH